MQLMNNLHGMAKIQFYMNVIKQDYPSLFLWQQLVKIIITSSSLLLEKDYVTIQSYK